MSSESAYGQGHAESVVRSQLWRSVDNSAAYLAPELRPGRSVLDVGCGPGTITVDLARRVAPGEVVGIDVSEAVLEQARAHARREGVSNVRFERADITTAPALGRFDIVHAHQVLLHLTDPVAALRHLLTLAKPGGVVAARDTDYAAAFWWPADSRLDRWQEVYRAVAHGNGTEPDAGRRLLAWAHAAGARDVTPSASIWCHSTPEERTWWGGMWAERILDSKIAEQAVAGGHASAEDLREISEAWRAWAADPDGWFSIPHGEILCRVAETG
ncbi:class I SAM-dependent methyltransferase [Amycolatopsis sp. VS8301801F10]|uniref:class I SAM-dependent methyltransferase n=1 Tax=Amycolatopsis sp. VS8301801F10 TaxID=2652442 RepID=UPI0038FC0987